MIDSNNKLNSLSKSLIDSVRGIMEGKESDHGTHPKTEREKDLAAKAPPHDKITHADVLAARGVLKKHPKTGKMVTKEEAEQIDEISAETKDSYAKKAVKQLPGLFNKSGKDADSARKYYNRKNTVRKIANEETIEEKDASLRIAGAVLNQMRNEDTEQLDELSRDTLRRYRMKSKSIGDNEKGDVTYRSKGRDLAARKTHGGQWGIPKAKVMASEEVELDEALDAAARYGDHHTAIKSLLKSIGEHIEHHKKDALAHKDYRGKKGVHWGHVGDVAQVHAQLADVHDRLAQQGEYAKSMKEDLDEDLTLEDIEQIDELSKDMMLKYLSANKKDDRKAQAAGDMDKMTKRMRGTDMAVRKYTAKPGSKYVKVPATEEVDLDESPVDGVAPGSMADDGHLCATKVFHKEWAEGTPIFSQHAEPDADGNIAWYDVMFEHGIEKMVSTDDLDILMSESHERHGKKMKEEIDSDLEAELKAQRQTKKSVEDAKKKYGVKEETEELDEARGRPRKNPQPEGQSDEPEPRQHIIQQLQRAKLSMRGGEHVTFKNGEKHLVHGSHAAKLLNRYAGMKPNEKEDFQKKIGASHESLKSEL